MWTVHFVNGLFFVVTKMDKTTCAKISEVLEVLDLQLRADICEIACTKTEQLGYEMSGKSIDPVRGKVQGTT